MVISYVIYLADVCVLFYVLYAINSTTCLSILVCPVVQDVQHQFHEKPEVILHITNLQPVKQKINVAVHFGDNCYHEELPMAKSTFPLAI